MFVYSILKIGGSHKMKVSKVIIPVFLVVALGFGWFSLFSETLNLNSGYSNCMSEAERSVDDGLYEQAIEYYKKSLDYEVSETTYKKIKEAYDKLYKEESTQFVREKYISDMSAASSAFPQSAMFWEKQTQLYLDSLNYDKAYSTVKKAFNYGANSKKLNELYTNLLYMVKTDYKLYYDYKTALNGYISVFDGDSWTVLDETGTAITGKYKFIGLINNDGIGLFTNDIDARILDAKEITRARFKINVEDAGYYSEKAGYLPVKVDGKWRYMNLKGDFLDGEYEIAGSFYNDKAVAYTGNEWFLVDTKGKKEKLNGIEDVKLDLYGCHNQQGIVIAKESGKYHFYDENFKRKNDFSADDIDICIDGKTVAFKKEGKWGFVGIDGKIVVEPKYSKAKSYSNRYAAVCNDEGLWGFLNDKYELCIDYSYKDAYYFNSKETCLVSITDNTVQLLHFMFD